MAIVVPVIADTAGLVRGLSKGSNSLTRFGKVAAIAAGAAGVGALVATMKVGIDEFRNSQRVTAQTNAVIKSTGGVAGITAKHVDKLARSIERKSMLDDEAIQSGQNLLLTFLNIRNEAGKGNQVFDRTVQAMADVSTAMGMDASTAAIQLGKAINDPVRGVGQLRRVGVSFTESQREQIKTLVESGKTMEAQKMILGELEKQFGGSAAAASKTLDGQLTILKNTFNNIAGDLVARFMPNVIQAAQSLVDFVKKFADAPTMNAKVKVVTEKIDVVWERVKTWWTTGERKELPSGIVVTPSGQQQVEQAVEATKQSLADRLEPKLNELGRNIYGWLFGGAGKPEDNRTFVEKFNSIGDSIKRFFSRDYGVRLGKFVVEKIVDGIQEAAGEAKFSWSEFFNDWFDNLDVMTMAGDFGESIGRRIAEGIGIGSGGGGKGGGGKGGKGGGAGGGGTATRPGPGARSLEVNEQTKKDLRNVFTVAFKDAVKSARESLVSGASSLASMLSERVSAGFRLNGTGRNAAEMTAEGRALEDRRLALQEQSLRDALAIAEDKTEAQLALDEFLYQKEATLRQRGVDDANAANTQQINDLVASFNSGAIGAQEFRDKLNGIIGAAPGADLGGAFAGAFDTQLQTVLGTAQDIFDTVSGTLNLTGASGLLEALRQSNDERFKAYIQRWESRRDALLDRIEDAKEILEDDEATDKQKAAAQTRKKKAEDALAALRARKKDRTAFGLALGGVLTKQVFTAGEAGPEAVMPLTGRGGEMLRDALGLGSGRPGCTYNITVNAGMGTSGIDLGREIVAAIKQYERTNGNVFVGA